MGIKRGLTKVEQERNFRKEVGEEKEKLSVLGQESDKNAVKFIQEEGKKSSKIAQQKTEDLLNKLGSTGKKHTYADFLIEGFKIEMPEFTLPKGYIWEVKRTNKGIILGFWSPRTHKWYVRGMSISGIPKFDLNAMTRFLFDAVDQMERMEIPNLKAQGIITN